MSIHYYDVNANAFFAATVAVDMVPLYSRFLDGLATGAHVLDAGCGSGRDAKAFAACGYKVSAFDASPALAQMASAHSGLDVQVRRFADVDEVAVFDAIWCCASLLHVPASEMRQTLASLWRALRPAGRLYVSFKHGQGQREHDGRSFTDADEPLVRDWMADLPELTRLDVWLTADQRPGRSERWTNALAYRKAVPPRRLVTGGPDHFLPHLSAAFARANRVDFAVAFVKATGLRLLLPDFQALADSHTGHAIRFLTSDYLDVTDPQALRLLLLLQERGAQVKVFTTQTGGSFHLKAYIFSQWKAGELLDGTAFVGSSNISRQALQEGLEWNYRVNHPSDVGFLEAQSRFEELFAHPANVALSDAWIEAYEKRRQPPPRAVAPGSLEQEPPPTPTAVQQAALDALLRTREDGFKRGLVVLATGLGKTWLAAFDAAALGARRVLFVAHREEILDQAAATFVRLMPDRRVGSYTGKARDANVDVLCASVQTLSKTEHLNRFSRQHFDYVVVDEFHHAAASSYKRLLEHFAPSFLLGLTATPDRTDQSDILTLCDDNLVHSCALFEGIQADLLAPFHYYGIQDEAVDYREIPWRNGRFDTEQLANKLATMARARHALKHWQEKGQRRTLAFCVSQRHADFMAAQFQQQGVAAAAVYAGSSLGRAQALEMLDAGSLQVVFSVDLFNEGVDVPSIDTVMMLRPTESKILFLQQLGRGLRRHPEKTHLVVLDFIGNHQGFLHKPQALFGVGSTYGALAAFAKQAQQQALDLPEGCFVNYDLALIDFLKSLDSSSPEKDYEALRSTLGHRPSLSEFFRAGSSLAAMRGQWGHWFALVKHMGDLSEQEMLAFDSAEPLLREVETTAMTKCFKAVLLEAWLEAGGLGRGIPLAELAERSRQVMTRRPKFLADLPEELRQLHTGDVRWLSYWRRNPVNAWIGGNQGNGSNTAFFTSNNAMFELRQSISANEAPALAGLIQELVDFRFASYERRLEPTPSSQVIALTGSRSNVVELPYFPNLKMACGHFRTGRTDTVEQRGLPGIYGALDPSRHFIAYAKGNSMDGGKNPIHDGDALLLELITPQRAGSITGQVVAIERQDDSGDSQYLLRVVTKSAQGQYILKAQNPSYEDLPATDDMKTLARLKDIIAPFDLALGQAFQREDIPALFGEVFNAGNWNSGHVALNDKKAHVLLVTLNKQGKAQEHRYFDHWIDPETFHWQSQNSTTPESKRGQELIHHEARGIAIHLFVRDFKLSGGKAAPFVYHGRVRYQSHQGSSPMSVTWAVS